MRYCARRSAISPAAYRKRPFGSMSKERGVSGVAACPRGASSPVVSEIAKQAMLSWPLLAT